MQKLESFEERAPQFTRGQIYGAGRIWELAYKPKPQKPKQMFELISYLSGRYFQT